MRSNISFLVLLLLLTSRNVALGLPDPGTGMQWQLTFNDEFDGSTVDKTKWNGGYADLQWCGSGTCPQDYAGLSISNGILSLQSNMVEPVYSSRNHRATMHTGGLTAGTAKFSQRFGYFEWRAKYPTNVNGEGDGLWIALWALPIGKSTFPGGCAEGNEEVDVLEAWLSRTNLDINHPTFHDYCVSQYNFALGSPTDLSKDFHLFGLLWVNDGSPHGSMQIYFDGVPKGKLYTLDSRSNLWDNGIYLINQIVPCSGSKQEPCTSSTSNNNPFLVDWVRAYKAVPVSTTDAGEVADGAEEDGSATEDGAGGDDGSWDSGGQDEGEIDGFLGDLDGGWDDAESISVKGGCGCGTPAGPGLLSACLLLFVIRRWQG